MDRIDFKFIKISSLYTKTGRARLHATLEILRRLDRKGVVGDFVECGVWNGGQIILARLVSPLRTCWLYDTFDGMTPPTDVDTKRSGDSASWSYFKKIKQGRKWAEASLEEVRFNLQKQGVLDDNFLRFVVGDVCKTLKIENNLPEQIAVLRLDTDWYESTKIELEMLYPRLVKGGVLIIDDYGHWMGARKAVDEYFSGRIPRWKWSDYSQVWTVKTC